MQRAKKKKKKKRIVEARFCYFFRVRRCAFSLKSRVIQPSDSFEPRRKVVLREEDNAWTPVLGSFDKLRVTPQNPGVR